MSPFVRTPADAIESYAAAGCFPIIGFFIQKRVASLFSCRRSFLLSPSATYSAHPADRAVPPHNTKKTAAPQRRSAANYPRRRNYFFAGSFSTALNTASALWSSKRVNSAPLISNRATSSSILTKASSGDHRVGGIELQREEIRLLIDRRRRNRPHLGEFPSRTFERLVLRGASARSHRNEQRCGCKILFHHKYI